MNSQTPTLPLPLQTLARDFVELTKPRLTLLSVGTALLGFVMGSGGRVDFLTLCCTVLGSLGVGAGANAFNELFEKDIDARMKRTENRPLPSGRLAPAQAFIFAATASATGLFILAFGVNLTAATLGLLTLFTYLFLYTPLKRFTALNTAVGAVSGALPILIGWTAAKAPLDARAWTLFAFLYIWQLPHFFAIAWVYKEDYLRGGLRMPTLHDRSGVPTAAQILFFCLILTPVSLLPALMGMTGVIYFGAAFLAGSAFLAFALFLFLDRLTHAKKFVSASILYMIIIIVFMMFDVRVGWSAEPPPKHGNVASFRLQEARGRSMSLGDLRGEVWVADFIFTRCAGQCPILSTKMRALQKTLDRRVKLVSFTVDPEYDKPSVLETYADGYEAKPGRWFFLTGNKSELDRALSSFHLNSTEEPTMHSLRFVLVDGQGAIRGYYDSSDAEAVKRLQKDASRLLKEGV